MSWLDRNHYQLLIELERGGTLSAAAQVLCITQSAASQRLREAERRFGFALTERTGRKIALTLAAQRLVEGARISERTLKTAEAHARWLGSAGAPALQLAQDVYDLIGWLAPLFAEIDERADLAALGLVRMPAGQGLTAILEGRADVMIAPAEAAFAPVAYPLFEDDLVAVVAADNPLADHDALTPEDFVKSAYVTHSTTPQDGFEYATFFAPSQVWPGRILRLESITAIIELVAASRWISILPQWTVPLDRGVVTVALDPNPPAISWSLISRDLDDFSDLKRTAGYLAARLPGLLRPTSPMRG